MYILEPVHQHDALWLERSPIFLYIMVTANCHRKNVLFCSPLFVGNGNDLGNHKKENKSVRIKCNLPCSVYEMVNGGRRVCTTRSFIKICIIYLMILPYEICIDLLTVMMNCFYG